MQNLEDYNKAIDGLALAIKSGAGTVSEFAENLTKSDVFCWDLVRMIRFADYDLYRSAYDYWAAHGDSTTLGEDMRCIAYAIIDASLENHSALNSHE
jgi:hypothetical protein